ncbi:MAG: ATP-grasp domain-containing protein [Candidatus Helarchaeota archaeon]
MVRLLEYEVKQLLQQANLPIPKRYSREDLEKKSIYPIIIKSQVPIGGRGKAGGIRIAKNPDEATKIINILMKLPIMGYLPKQLLFEEKLTIIKEYYCGFLVNRDTKGINFLFSESGGINIEELKVEDNFYLQEFHIFPENLRNLSTTLVKDIKLPPSLKEKLISLVSGFLQIIREYDAELFEINPLIQTPTGHLICADARMTIDDNSLFRHPEYRKNLAYYLTPPELQARKFNMAYVELEGNIGVICNGAGLVMGTIDTLQTYGAKAANFLDVGGGADAERMYHALQIISKNKQVHGILINIIGGITRCDEIAKGFIQFFKENRAIKYSLRLIGTNEKKGQELLAPYNIKIHRDLDAAIQSLIEKLLNNFIHNE